MFDDGTRFELYGENFSCCSGLDKARGLADYVEMAGGKIVRTYGAIANRPPEPRTTARWDRRYRDPFAVESPTWSPSQTRQVFAMALALNAIEKAKGR